MSGFSSGGPLHGAPGLLEQSGKNSDARFHDNKASSLHLLWTGILADGLKGSNWPRASLSLRLAAHAQVLFAVASYQLPADFSPMDSNAYWSADFSIDQPGVTLQWQFAFAAYSDFAGDNASLNTLQPQPVADSMAAGTPGMSTYNGDVLAGGRNLGTYEDGFYQYTGARLSHTDIVCIKAHSRDRSWWSHHAINHVSRLAAAEHELHVES